MAEIQISIPVNSANSVNSFKTISMIIDINTTVESIKEYIYDRGGKEPKNINLYYDNKLLTNEEKIINNNNRTAFSLRQIPPKLKATYIHPDKELETKLNNLNNIYIKHINKLINKSKLNIEYKKNLKNRYI